MLCRSGARERISPQRCSATALDVRVASRGHTRVKVKEHRVGLPECASVPGPLPPVVGLAPIALLPKRLLDTHGMPFRMTWLTYISWNNTEIAAGRTDAVNCKGEAWLQPQCMQVPCSRR